MNAHAALVRELPLAQPLERRRLQCYLALLLGDCAMLFGGYIAAGALYLGADGAGKAAVLAQLVLPLFLTIALYNGAYSIDALIRPRRGILRALVAYALSAALVVAIAYYAKSSAAFSRVVLICPLQSGPISILELAMKEEWNGKEAQAGGDHRQAA